MTNKQLALERLHRNGVLSPFPSVEKCVGNLAGIQAQVQQFSELAVLPLLRLFVDENLE